MTIVEAKETKYGIFPFHEEHADSINEADKKMTKILNIYLEDGFEIVESRSEYVMIDDSGEVHHVYIMVP